MAKPENPSEPFKRAVSVAVRSLAAAEPEMEVSFSSEPPSLKGLKARLPSPTRNLSAHDVALVRGTGDAYALRKAYHDEKVNSQFRPPFARRRRHLRGGRAGARRSDRIAGHEGRRRQSRQRAGEPHAGPRSGQGQGPRGSAHRRCAGPDGARASDRPEAAGLAGGRGGFVAAFHRGESRRRSRQAGRRLARPEGLRPPHPHHAEPSGLWRPE